jgi:hypothetical protein
LNLLVVEEEQVLVVHQVHKVDLEELEQVLAQEI